MKDKIFREFCSKVKTRLKCEDMLFKNMTFDSDEKRIKFILNVMWEYDIIPRSYEDVKNARISENYRQQGKTLFHLVKPPYTVHNCVEVIKLFNKSIACAPPETEKLALGYANRSVILIKLNKYELSRQDIERALELPCSGKVRGKLYIRKVQCLRALGDPQVDDVIEKARCISDKLPVDDSFRQKLIERLEFMKIANYGRMQVEIPEQLDESVEITPSREVPCASEAIEIRYDDTYGRHVVATRDITEGDVIIMEKPYLKILTIEKIYVNCANCFKVSWACIPCDHCTSAMYCSEHCKAQSWEKYHDLECPVYSSAFHLSKRPESTLCGLRLTILALKELGSIEALREEVNVVDYWTDPRTKGFSDNGLFTSDKYRNVLALETNFLDRSRHELFEIGLHSCFLLCYLAARTSLLGTPFRENLVALSKNEDAVFIGGLIFRHLQLSRSNGLPIHEEFDQPGDWSKCGFGIFPFSSLMKDSCNPNTAPIHKHLPICNDTWRYTTKLIRTDEQVRQLYT